MLPIFTKPLDLVTDDDVAELIDQQWPESGTVEFKENLPGPKGRPDPWWNGGAIADRSRDELLSEVVAFSNSHGGTLVLGIMEASDKPPRAVGWKPLPRCGELADRLTEQIRQCVEPRIPTFEIRGIPIEKDGSGVVVIRVPFSRHRPHRLETTRHAYHRKADRCEKMTMREIQDLTLFAERRSGEIDRAFEERRDSFRKWITEIPGIGDRETKLAIRGTAIPASADVYVEKVVGNNEFFPRLRQFGGELNGPVELFVPGTRSGGFQPERPIFRGAQRTRDVSGSAAYQEVQKDGTIEIAYKIARRDGVLLFLPWIMGVCANVLVGAHSFRTAAGAPDIEYLFELELSAWRGDLEIGRFGSGSIDMLLGVAEPNPLVIRLSIGAPDEFTRLLNIILDDICDAAGVGPRAEQEYLSIDFGDALRHV